MRKSLVSLVAMAVPLAACATDPYGQSSIENRATVGVLAGAALGALAGQAAGGNPITGAAAGMVVGGAAGILIKGPVAHGRHSYRDSRGYCYYVNQAGQPTYDPSVAC